MSDLSRRRVTPIRRRPSAKTAGAVTIIDGATAGKSSWSPTRRSTSSTTARTGTCASTSAARSIKATLRRARPAPSGRRRRRTRPDPCGNQISGALRHRRDVVSVAASARWRGSSRRSDNLTHWLIASQVGAWPSEKSFQRECDCQALAAKGNSAPAVRARAWAGGAAGVGAIVMDRLTCPSFHVWSVTQCFE